MLRTKRDTLRKVVRFRGVGGGGVGNNTKYVELEEQLVSDQEELRA